MSGEMARVLVTGAAGFIGSQTARALLDQGHEVIGLDNMNSYYDVSLKRARLAGLEGQPGFSFLPRDVVGVEELAGELSGTSRIVHLAAQAGVRYSITNPVAYFNSNLLGFGSVLELARTLDVEHLVYASSSSVYGANRKLPFSVADEVNHPVSLYAATKRANELMAESYSHLYRLPATGLRFFTVYGPWGRPDMAIFGFTEKILRRQTIELFGGGELTRDFTYIDDIVGGLLQCLDRAPRPGNTPGLGVNETSSPHRVLNLGRGEPVSVLQMVRLLENALGIEADIKLIDRQPGDVDHTLSDITETTRWCGYRPSISLEAGIAAFVDWYRSYYAVAAP